MRQVLKPATSEHEAFRQDLLALLRKHGAELSAIEMLALASCAVGQLVAMQDQRKVTPTEAMEVVARNVEQGNAEVIARLQNSRGSA